MLDANNDLSTCIHRGTDTEGKLYGIAIASGKTWAEQRRFFSQYLASSKNKFDDICREEAETMCQEVSMQALSPKGEGALEFELSSLWDIKLYNKTGG